MYLSIYLCIHVYVCINCTKLILTNNPFWCSLSFFVEPSFAPQPSSWDAPSAPSTQVMNRYLYQQQASDHQPSLSDEDPIGLIQDPTNYAKYHEARKSISCCRCLFPTELCCVLPYGMLPACFFMPPFCLFGLAFLCTWADNQIAVRTKPNRPLSSLIITDRGLSGYDWLREKDLKINWAQITSLEVKFYKVTKDTKCWKCTDTTKVRDEARLNGTAHIYTRHRKKAYNLDIFDEAGGGIYSDSDLSVSFGFGLCLPCYILHLAIIPSQEFNCIEIKGTYNNQRAINFETHNFKFRLHGIKVQQQNSSSINIYNLLNDPSISSENAEQYLIDIIETKRVARFTKPLKPQNTDGPIFVSSNFSDKF